MAEKEIGVVSDDFTEAMDSAQSEIKALKDLLIRMMPFAWHKPDCPMARYNANDIRLSCTCGYDQIFADFKEMEE